jgi:hypothetical protein
MLLMARVLALLWAGFWMFFFIAEALAWRTPARVVVSWGGVGLLFVLLAVLPWRWEVAGGLVLLVFGLLIGVAYPFWPLPLPLASRAITTIVLSGPPLVAGVGFLIHHRAVTART